MEKSELIKAIDASQNGDFKSGEEIMKRFSPILKKYAYYLNYEDAYSDLQYRLIEAVMNLKTSGFTHNAEFALISYLTKVIYRSYIKLSVHIKSHGIKEKILAPFRKNNSIKYYLAW